MDKETLKKTLLILTGVGLLVLVSMAIIQSPSNGSSAQTSAISGDPTDVNASPEYDVPKPPPLLANGTKAPDFTLGTSDGKFYTLSEFAGKKAVLVEMLSTRCPHCQHSTVTLKDLNKKHADSLQILAINAGDSPEDPSTSEAFVKEYGLTYPLLEKPSSEMMTAYNLYAFPTFYLVDKTGTIVWSHRGTYSPETMAEMETHL